MRIFVASMVDLQMPDAQRVHLMEKWSRIAAMGHDIHLWVFGRDPDFESMFENKIVVRRIPHLNVRFLRGISFQLLLMVSLVFNILSSKPSMIYVRSSAADFAPLLVALIFRIPLGMEFPGPPTEEASSYGLSRSRIELTNLLIVLKTRCASVIVTVTEPIKKDISLNYRVHPNKIHVIQNAANTELFKPLARNDALKRLGLDIRKKYVGFVGNISPWHGVDVLTRAGAEVLRSCPEVVFHIIGEGVMKARLEKEVEEMGLAGNFLFAGAVPYKQVPLYVSSCDLMALPLITKSTNDSGYSPLKLYEYMACGKPIVASRLIGLEMVEEEGIGRLVAPNDAGHLSSAIIAMISDPGALIGMGTRARLLATTKFDWQRVAERTEKLIVDIVR